MKKSLLAFVCLAIGCAAGATLPAVTAQSFPPNPKVQRWEGYCQTFERLTKDGAVELLNEYIKQGGAQGFEPFTVVGGTTGYMCFKRPTG